MITMGDRIKHLRILAGLSQEELGNRVGVQRAAINKYEKGTVTNIPIQTIEKMATVFDVSPTYIVGWDTLNTNPLAAEAKILRGVKHFYGQEVVDAIHIYTNLNDIGKKRVCQVLEEMSALYSNGDDTLIQ